MISNKNINYLWLISALVIYLVSYENKFSQLFYPLLFTTVLIYLLQYQGIRYIEYFLFFSISIVGLLGYTQNLTGSHAESSNVLFYGLSFYTASISYLLAKNLLYPSKILIVSNPLLLFTGPIALYVKSIHHKKKKLRIKYFIPFVIVGLFMFLVIASPLTEFFYLLDRTDIISSVLFAVIFEIFVYMNFCGLSLLLYGFFGIFGYRIPLNFKQPFSSNNIVEFWKGWHTSLSIVLKTLFYKPLRGKFSLIIALVGVYLASAMWHGVTLNFFIWGIFHALTFWLTIQLLKRSLFLPSLILMPFIIIIGRMIFADNNISQLIEKLSFNFNNFEAIELIINGPTASLMSLFLGIGMVFTEYFLRNSRIMHNRNYKYVRTPIVLLLLSFIGLILVSTTGLDYAVYGQR